MDSNLGVGLCCRGCLEKGLEFVACAGVVDAMFVFSSLHVNLIQIKKQDGS